LHFLARRFEVARTAGLKNLLYVVGVGGVEQLKMPVRRISEANVRT
jgi:hypothetical protein